MMLQTNKRQHNNKNVNLISKQINSKKTTATATVTVTAKILHGVCGNSSSKNSSSWSRNSNTTNKNNNTNDNNNSSCNSNSTPKNNRQQNAYRTLLSLKLRATCFHQSTFLWMLLLQLLLSLALPIAADTSNGNLTDLGSPVFKRPFNMTWTLILLLLSASTLAQQLIPNGSQQLYELINQLSENSVHSNKQITGYIFRCQLKVNSVWHNEQSQLLQIYITEPSVSVAGKSTDKLIKQDITKIPDRPFYISLIDGIPSKVIAHTSRDQSLLNLERGVASLLQLRFENGPVKELDVSGHCNAFYDVKSSTRIEKIKTDCSNWDLRVIDRGEMPLGVQQHSKEDISFNLNAEGMLLQATSKELHQFSLKSKPDVGSKIQSLFSLQHLAVGQEVPEQLKFSTLDEAIKSLLDWYRVFDIEADVDGALSELKHTTLKQQIASLKDKLNDAHIGKETLALVMAELLPLARITKKDEFIEILKEYKEQCNQIVDLLGAVQTVDAYNAINEVFNYTDESDTDVLEKYLQSLALGTHPERGILEDLLNRLKDTEKPIQNEKLQDTVVQTLSSLTHQYGFDPNDTLLQQIREYILKSLEADCKQADIDCRTVYIRALQNLQDPTTLPILLSYAMSGDAKMSVTAMQAIKSFPIVYFKEAERKVFTDIFYQRLRKYDSSARALALDILFNLKPTKAELGQLIDYLNSNDRHFEIKTYVIQTLRMLADKCPRFRSLLQDCLKERPHINNYDVFAQKGQTTVLTRQISQAPAFNESLLSVQEIYQGVLKRGSVEMLLNAGRDEISTFKLGIYTSGLSSFVGDDSDENNEIIDDEEVDDSPSTAGMEISVQDVRFRPLIFFSGQTELMSHVWKGTASDPTPAYQATTLAHDHEQYVIVASGATIYVRLVGMKSVDLNGKVELSIWNRNAHTKIQQNTGTGVVGLTVAGFTYAKVEHKYTIAYEPSISLQANLDFYTGIKLCMQLQRPDISLTQMNAGTVYLNAEQPLTKTVRSKFTHKSAGLTYALNQKNNEMCNMIFPTF